jgi:hypothetical protein
MKLVGEKRTFSTSRRSAWQSDAGWCPIERLYMARVAGRRQFGNQQYGRAEDCG